MLLHRHKAVTRVVLTLSLCAAISGCRDNGTHEVSQFTLAKGIVKVGMSAHDVKTLLGPPHGQNSQVLTCSSATSTNAESTRILYWVLETASWCSKQTVVYDLYFTATHPWEQVPGDPASGSDKEEAGWTLETIRLHVINERDFQRWKNSEQTESQ